MHTLKAVAIFLLVPLTLSCRRTYAPSQPPHPTRSEPQTQWIGDLSPIQSAEWTEDNSAHLLERAGFGGTPEEIRNLTALGPRAAVSSLVNFEQVPNKNLPSFQHSQLFDLIAPPLYLDQTAAFNDACRGAEVYGIKRGDDGLPSLQAVLERIYLRRYGDSMETRRLEHWWAERMLTTQRPLEERMVLFWHDHFATRASKIRDFRKMHRQIETFRQHALGNFRDLLRSMIQDPAMMVFLDQPKNTRGQAIENLAREVMELFVLGVGNYTERDVREVARALTGWTLDAKTESTAVFNPDRHDPGIKKILGRTGHFDAEDVVEILLSGRNAARFLVRKLYEFFVRSDPTPAIVTHLATVLLESDYELRPLLGVILSSRDFYSPATVGSQFKSPVHYVISTYRKLGFSTLPSSPSFHDVCARLGQILCHPPSVAGWDRGQAWINSVTLVERRVFARQVLGLTPPNNPRPERGVGIPLTKMRVDLGDFPSQSLKRIGRDPVADSSGERNQNSFNHRLARVRAKKEALKIVAPISNRQPHLDVIALMERENRTTATEVVDHLLFRFLRVPVDDARRRAFIEFLTERAGARLDRDRLVVEAALLDLVGFVLALPEYQLT